jgi:hypothetical protein
LVAFLVLVGLLVGGCPDALATDTSGLEDAEWTVSVPSLFFTAANGSLVAVDDPSVFLGSLGAIVGLFTGVLGLALREPVMIVTGSASIAAAALAIHRSGQARTPSSTNFSIGPTLIGPKSAGVVLSVRF